MTQIKCRISTVSLREEYVLHINIAAEQRFGVEDFLELKAAAEKLGGGKKLYNLIEVGALTVPDKESRELSSSVEGSTFKAADAFVISSLPQKIIANLITRVNKPAVPTRFFNDRVEAEEWLSNQMKKDQFLNTG